MFSIQKERSGDSAAVEHLLDLAFGPGRFAKSSYRLREDVDPIEDLCFTGWQDGVMQGSVRFWPILVGNVEGCLLLGPLAVNPAIRGKGLGVALVEHGLKAAGEMGYKAVFLVGDEPYYARMGFHQTIPGRFIFPGPLDPQRLLLCDLTDGFSADLTGEITRPR